MKSMLQAIGRAIRAMSRATAGFVKKTIVVAGRLVTIFLPSALPPIDELEPKDVPANDNLPISECQPLRDLAYASLQGRMPTAQELGAVTQRQADWLCAMDAEMTRRLLKSSDAEIRAHVLGIRPIRGVLPCDADAIDDYVTAVAINTARLERDLGLTDGCAARQPA